MCAEKWIQWIDLWEKGNYTALVEGTVQTNKKQHSTDQQLESKEYARQVYMWLLLQGKFSQAIRWVTGCEKGRILWLVDINFKTAGSVSNVLLSEYS
eukprot:15301848-Ditylum_brightwellii.AAC.1